MLRQYIRKILLEANLKESIERPDVFKPKFNNPSIDLNTAPNTAGVLKFIRDYNQLKSLEQKKKYTNQRFGGPASTIYRAIKASAHDSTKKEIFKKMKSDKQLALKLDKAYLSYVHMNGKLGVELDRRVRSLSGSPKIPNNVDFSKEGLRISYQYDPGEHFHQFNMYRLKNFIKRRKQAKNVEEPTSKVYYSINPLLSSFSGVEFKSFLEEYRQAILNFGLQLCVLVGYEPWLNHSYLDHISFKIPNKIEDLLQYNDDIVIYTDNYKESKEVEKRINATITKLNSTFKYMKITTAAERRASGRPVIGVDPGTSDTDAFARYVVYRIISDTNNFRSFDQWVNSNKNNMDIESVWSSFQSMFNPIYTKVGKEWMNMSGIERKNAFKQASNFT